MSEIYLVIKDEDYKKPLPDISYSQYIESHLYTDGSSDMAYDNYLRDRGMVDPMDLNPQTTPDTTIVFENTWNKRILRYECVYDSDNDPNFEPSLYFKE